MINKIKEQIIFIKNFKKNFKKVEAEIIELRKTHSIFTLFAENTGYSNQGVKSAGISLFPNNWIALPHYYSHSLLSPNDHKKIGELIGYLNFDQLIFNSFTPYFYDIAAAAKEVYPKIKVKVIHHGFLAEFSGDEFQRMTFNKIIEGRRSGVIDAIGFVKKGLALTIEKYFNLSCFEIILPNNKIRARPPFYSENLNIGCLVNNSFRKNIHNQVMAASLIEEAKVHVFKNSELDYLDRGQFIQHEYMKHEQFYNLLGSMNVNLHVTFSEGMGGQVCSESISQGVPCLSADTSAFFDYDIGLKEKLVVKGFDDSWYIYQKIQELLNDYDNLSKLCLEYSKHLNTLAKHRMNAFLGA